MKEELEKLFRCRLILGLLLLSVIVNLFLLLMQRDKIDMLNLIDNFSMDYGSIVSDEKMMLLAESWNEKKVNDISWEEFKADIEKSAEYYESLQSSDMASAYCNLMHLEGKAAEYVQAEFHKLDDSIREASEQELTFFPPYRMHIFDFITTNLLFVINLEGVMVAVILTLYSVDMERRSHTVSIIYSTRKGKKVFRDKLLASVTGSLICFLVIIASTFLLADCIFSIKIIMNTLVSNPMVNLKGAPCIMNEAMTIGKYIFISLGISSIIAVTFSLGSFAIGLRAENSYYALGSLIILLGIMRVISTMAPTSTYVFFWVQYNPLDLTLKAGTWFLYNSHTFSPSWYEGCTAVLWMVVCIIGCICGLRSKEKGRGKI